MRHVAPGPRPVVRRRARSGAGTPPPGRRCRSLAGRRRACRRRPGRPSRISSSRSQRPASSMTWLETNSVVPAAARAWKRAHRSWRSTGSSPTVGSSRTSSSGAASSAQARETRPAARPTACPTCLGRAVGQPDVGQRAVGVGAGRAVEGGEVAGVVPGREVAVDATAVWVTYPTRRRSGASRPACRAPGPRPGRPLHPDDAAHERGLAAAARPQQAGHLAGRHRERQAGEDGAAAEGDDDVADLDRLGHRRPRCRRRRAELRRSRRPLTGPLPPRSAEACRARPHRARGSEGPPARAIRTGRFPGTGGDTAATARLTRPVPAGGRPDERHCGCGPSAGVVRAPGVRQLSSQGPRRTGRGECGAAVAGTSAVADGPAPSPGHRSCRGRRGVGADRCRVVRAAGSRARSGWASTVARSIGPARPHRNGRRWPRCSWTLRCRTGLRAR